MNSFWKGRLWIYLITIAMLFAVFAKPMTVPPGPFTFQLGYYFGVYALPLMFWISVFEFVYRLSIRLRKPVNKRS